MFNQINLSSIYIMKINYILLGVTIILIILMMCSNKTEGFVNHTYTHRTRSCVNGQNIANRTPRHDSRSMQKEVQ